MAFFDTDLIASFKFDIFDEYILFGLVECLMALFSAVIFPNDCPVARVKRPLSSDVIDACQSIQNLLQMSESVFPGSGKRGLRHVWRPGKGQKSSENTYKVVCLSFFVVICREDFELILASV